MSATAYFCNCVAEMIGVNVNAALAPKTLVSRAVSATGDFNQLPMASFPVTIQAETGQFAVGAGTKNTVGITFEAVREEANWFDIKVTDELKGRDLFFYIFEQTLIGQDQYGASGGILIRPQAWYEPSSIRRFLGHLKLE